VVVDYNYKLGGTGSGTSLSLSGEFPMESTNGQTSLTTESDFLFRATTIVSENEVYGTVVGQFDDDFGTPCEVTDGVFELVR
jgi:hypothetical protein